MLADAIAINAAGVILAGSGTSDYYLLTPSTNPVPGPPPCVVPSGPPQGTDGKVVHAGSRTTLTYKDVCGGERSYPVSRPSFFAPALTANTDGGAWIYAAPDKQSGINFNVSPSGGVSAVALTGAALHMVVGP
jgi:hypothetical protein